MPLQTMSPDDEDKAYALKLTRFVMVQWVLYKLNEKYKVQQLVSMTPSVNHKNKAQNTA